MLVDPNETSHLIGKGSGGPHDLGPDIFSLMTSISAAYTQTLEILDGTDDTISPVMNSLTDSGD